MNCDVNVKSADFKTIHNSLWELGCINNPKVDELVEKIRTALGDAYEQDNRAFERKHDYYDQVRKELKCKSIWSIYEVADLYTEHPYTDAEVMIYKDHWGLQPVSVPLAGKRWIDLWIAADHLINQSGDGHHIYIEGFDPFKDKPGHIRLGTGS